MIEQILMENCMKEVRTEVSEEDKEYYKSIITHDQAVVFIARVLRATRCDIHYEGRPHHVDNALSVSYTHLTLPTKA